MRNSYVCIHNAEDKSYEVGFFDSEKGWVTESIHTDPKMATNRAIYLNGGNGWIINYLEERLKRFEQVQRYEKESENEGYPSEAVRRDEMKRLVQLLKGEWQMQTLSMS